MVYSILSKNLKVALSFVGILQSSFFKGVFLYSGTLWKEIKHFAQ